MGREERDGGGKVIEHTITPTREELIAELERVKAHLSAMDDKLDVTYPYLRQLYAMWPNEKLKEFLAASGEF